VKKSLLAAIAFSLTLPLALAVAAQAQSPRPARNVIIFVADGLRYGSVTAADTPNLWRLKREGVDFANSHSLFPTVTTVNASAISTGHYIGDTGNFGNTLWSGAPLKSENGSPMGGMEDPLVQAELNQRFEGNYLGETSLMARARAAGWSTAVIGKTGATRIQDTTAPADNSETLIVDDNMGKEAGFPLPAWVQGELARAHVTPVMPAVTYPNIEQQVNLAKVATRIVLPRFKAEGKPFLLTFWSRDPDISQHNSRDSLGELDPGINGPTSLAAVRNADTTLGEIRAALRSLGLDKTTDIFVTADHGFVTNARTSATSPSAKNGEIAAGFLAADLSIALKLRRDGNMLGEDAARPDAIIAPNGGNALIYLPGMQASQQARDIAAFLTTQDYVSGLFVNDRLGKIPGALAMSDVNLIGSARTPQPDLVVNFRSFAGACGTLQCARGNYGNATGQGSHGGLSRAETRNFMAAAGPSFKTGYVDPAPISNADIAPTLAQIMGLDLPARGKLTGRVIREALKGGAPAVVRRATQVSEPAANGLRTYLNTQSVGQTRYFDAAGFPGRTVGLSVSGAAPAK
jgi:arylsulfatase A-like enzyme